MAVKINLKEIDWMYQAPRKREDHEEVRVPPTSQIPMLGGMPDEAFPDEQPKQALIKDTDTPYIILSKNGGRRDLLRFRENNQPDPNVPAKDYPRCDWYYLEDNQIEEEQTTEGKDPWVFHLPEYMVHQPWNPNGKPMTGVRYGPNERGRPPFATQHDVPNHMVRFDKRNRLPEVRKHGYGVRAERQAKSDEASCSKGPTAKDITVKAKPHSEADLKKKARRGYQEPKDNPCDRPAMGKLLSMGYAKDWEDSHDAYERERADAARQQAEKLRNLQARIHAREVQQTNAGQKFGGGGGGGRGGGGGGGGTALKPWRPTTKAGDLL